MLLKRLHLIIGFLAVAVFVATGFYLRSKYTDPPTPDDTQRFLYRANHVYILFSGLVNIGVGIYMTMSSGWRRDVQVAGSIMLLLGPFVLLAAFLSEPPRITMDRYITAAGALLVFLGVMLHLPGRRAGRRE